MCYFVENTLVILELVETHENFVASVCRGTNLHTSDGNNDICAIRGGSGRARRPGTWTVDALAHTPECPSRS